MSYESICSIFYQFPINNRQWIIGHWIINFTRQVEALLRKQILYWCTSIQIYFLKFPISTDFHWNHPWNTCKLLIIRLTFLIYFKKAYNFIYEVYTIILKYGDWSNKFCLKSRNDCLCIISSPRQVPIDLRVRLAFNIIKQHCFITLQFGADSFVVKKIPLALLQASLMEKNSRFQNWFSLHKTNN